MERISNAELYEEIGETNHDNVMDAFFGQGYFDEGIDPSDMIFTRDTRTGGLIKAEDSVGNVHYPQAQQ